MSLSPPFVYVCMGLMALVTAMVFFTRSLDSLLSVSVRRVHVVSSTTGFKGEGKPCSKARDSWLIVLGHI